MPRVEMVVLHLKDVQTKTLSFRELPLSMKGERLVESLRSIERSSRPLLVLMASTFLGNDPPFATRNSRASRALP